MKIKKIPNKINEEYISWLKANIESAKQLNEMANKDWLTTNNEDALIEAAFYGAKGDAYLLALIHYNKIFRNEN